LPHVDDVRATTPNSIEVEVKLYGPGLPSFGLELRVEVSPSSSEISINPARVTSSQAFAPKVGRS
jgi:hypothetical protein